jgi:hypothetical protein
LDFLYESGLAVGKGSSEGFEALQQSAPGAAASSSSAGDSSKVLLPAHSVFASLGLSPGQCQQPYIRKQRKQLLHFKFMTLLTTNLRMESEYAKLRTRAATD